MQIIFFEIFLMLIFWPKTKKDSAIAELLKHSEIAFEAKEQSALTLISKLSALKRACSEKQLEVGACLKEKKKLVKGKRG